VRRPDGPFIRRSTAPMPGDFWRRRATDYLPADGEKFHAALARVITPIRGVMICVSARARRLVQLRDDAWSPCSETTRPPQPCNRSALIIPLRYFVDSATRPPRRLPNVISTQRQLLISVQRLRSLYILNAVRCPNVTYVRNAGRGQLTSE